MTAKLTDGERRRRALARVIADFGAIGVPAPESLGETLSMAEDLIRIRRSGWSEPFPIGDGATWQTLEDLCCHRWAIMALIAEHAHHGRRET